MSTSVELVVHARQVESDGVISLVLARPDGSELPPWAPGAHIDLILGNGMTRQYSLSSDPAERTHWRIGVLREAAGRGGSEYVHNELQAGDKVSVSLPRNNFPLEEAPEYLFVAGGIGITPILPMIAQAHARGARWRLLYGGRTRPSMAFVDELSGYGDRVTTAPQDEFGLLDIAGALAAAPGAQVYACGPEPLLQAIEAAMAGTPDALHLERFSPKTIEITGADHEFEVEFVDLDVVITVPADRSILAVAEEAGVPVFSSCQEGTCGTCVTTIVSGRAEHRDSLLTESEQQEQSSMLICVSRAAKDCQRMQLRI